MMAQVSLPAKPSPPMSFLVSRVRVFHEARLVATKLLLFLRYVFRDKDAFENSNIKSPDEGESKKKL